MTYTTDLNGRLVKIADVVEVTLVDRAAAAGKARAMNKRPMHNRVQLAKWLKVPYRQIDHAVWMAYFNGYRGI